MSIDKVSVIMPCYNDGMYIQEAIESVRKQTYNHWEIVIIDDGSDCEITKEELKKLSNDEKIRIIHTNHIGPAATRNTGIKQCSGKYILPLDSDDKIDKTYVEKAVQILKSDDKIGVVYCEADLFGEESGKWILPRYSFNAMLLDNIVFVTALFYKEDWEKVGGFNTNMDIGMEDYDFWLSILETGKEIYQIPETLFHYRIKPKSRTTRFQSNYEDVKRVYQDMYDNHREFYELYKEEYAKVLRDALIDQIALRTKYDILFKRIKKYYQVPFVRFIINRIIGEI